MQNSTQPTEPAPIRAVIVHWNQAFRCRETALRLVDNTTEVVIVDNGSEPEHLAEIRRVAADIDGVTLVETGENLGFGPGANVGMRFAMAQQATGWVTVCPHDAHVEPHTIEMALELLNEAPGLGLACADVGDAMVPVHDPYFGGMIVAGPPHDPADGPRLETVDYPHGTFMFARVECLKEIGLFDERYFAYCEEADLGARAREAGWTVGLLRGVPVTNTSVTTNSALVDYLQYRNTLLLVKEHSGRYHATIRWLIAGGQLVKAWIAPHRSTQFAFDGPARMRAMIDAPLGRFGPPPADLIAGARRAELARTGDSVGDGKV